jgi:starvation-inducible DNA-binding protein
MNSSLEKDFEVLVADLISIELFAKGAHWNVMGASFPQYHEFFDDIYEDVASAVDPAAEMMRKLGAFPCFLLTDLVKYSSLEFTNPGSDAVKFMSQLRSAFSSVILDLTRIAENAGKLKEFGIQNFVADLQDRFEKWVWQLSSTLSGGK